MKAKYVIGVAVILGAAIFGATAFQGSMTPYVDFAQAKQSGDRCQIMGDLIQEKTSYETSSQTLLFTLVDDETRYKAKPVIDIVVYRGGDMATAWLHTGLRELLQLGLGGVAIVGAIVAGIWAYAGIYLGRTYNKAINENHETTDVV